MRVALAVLAAAAVAAIPASAAAPAGWIAFVSRGEVHLVRPDGTGLRRLTRTAEAESSPVWSQDGRSLAYVRGTDIVVHTLRTGVRRVVAGGADPDVGVAWSPTGKLAFGVGDDLAVVPAAGGETTRLHVLQDTGRTPMFFDVEWGSDGESLFVYVDNVENVDGLVLVAPDGSARELRGTREADQDPRLSPDGGRLAFVRRVPTPKVADSLDHNVFVARADLSRPTRLTGGRFDVEPSWSPDGRRIVFVSDRKGTRGRPLDLFLLDVRSRTVTRLTRLRGDERDPAWQPR